MAASVKLSVNLSGDAVAALRSIADDQNISMTEAIRRAIGTEKFLTEEVKKGSKILVEGKDKKVRQIILR